MPTYSVARLAASDMRSIIRYTHKRWGHAQTLKYTQDLHVCFQLLADNPNMGRDCTELYPGLKRFERGRHVVFFLVVNTGVLVARVLHQQMLPEMKSFGL